MSFLALGLLAVVLVLCVVAFVSCVPDPRHHYSLSLLQGLEEGGLQDRKTPVPGEKPFSAQEGPLQPRPGDERPTMIAAASCDKNSSSSDHPPSACGSPLFPN